MPDLTRRHLLAGAAATAAVAAMPPAAIIEPFQAPPYVDGQRFFDGKIDWTFYGRRREWIGVDREIA